MKNNSKVCLDDIKRDLDNISRQIESLKSSFSETENMNGKLLSTMAIMTDIGDEYYKKHAADGLESGFKKISDTAKKFQSLPGTVAMLTDMLDGFFRSLKESGVDIDKRLKTLREIIVTLTEPETLESLLYLSKQLVALKPFFRYLDTLPGLLAMFVDKLDELYKRSSQSGVDLEEIVKNGALVTGKLSGFLQSENFKALSKSGIFDPKAVAIVGEMANALTEASTDESKRKMGLFGAVRSSSDQHIQSSIGFLVNFAKHFGESVDSGAKLIE